MLIYIQPSFLDGRVHDQEPVQVSKTLIAVLSHKRSAVSKVMRERNEGLRCVASSWISQGLG